MAPVQPSSEHAPLGEQATAVEAAALVASSALFSFVLFKLLSFFVTPANLVLCFLIAAHPAGVLLADRWYRRRERRAVQHYVVALTWSVASLFLLKHLHPALPQPGARPGLALSEVLTFTVLAAASQGPFFLFTGVVELLALRAAERATGSTSRAYAVILGGTAAGLAAGYATIGWAGAAGLTSLAAGVAAALAAPRGNARRAVASLAVILVAASAVWPAIDAAFVGAIQPLGPSTAQEHLQRGGRLIYSRWDRHAYTQVIARGDVTVGAYDNFTYWEAHRKPKERGGGSLPADAVVFHALRPGGTVGIVGVGGGRQVQEALWSNRSLTVEGFEINGSIVDFFSRLDPSANGGAYVAPGVHVHGTDGRRGIAEGSTEYDCIYLPDAGTAFAYYRSLVADPLFLYTRESYRGYLSRLRPDGVIVTAFALPSNPDRIVTRRVNSILADLGLEVRSYTNTEWDILVAARPREASATFARLDELAPLAKLARLAPATAATAVARADAATQAIGDDSGFFVPYFLFSVYDRLPGHFARALALGLALALGALVLLARRARRGAGGAAPLPRLATAAVLGANFVILENALVLSIARVLWSTTDAVILGSAYFLVCAVAGTFAARSALRRSPAFLGLFALALAAAAWTALRAASLPAMLGGWLPVCVLSGALFPAVLERSGRAQTRFVYAADSVGALLGIVVVFFVPLLSGISAFGLVALAVCALAAGAVLAWSAVTPLAPAAADGAFDEPSPPPMDERRSGALTIGALAAAAITVALAIKNAPRPMPIEAAPNAAETSAPANGPTARPEPTHAPLLRPLDEKATALLGDLTVGATFTGSWRVEALGIADDGSVEVDLARQGASFRLQILPRGKRPHAPPAHSDRYDVFYALPSEPALQPPEAERLDLCTAMATRLGARKTP